MKVVSIGAGNVATQLTLKLYQLGFDIKQVFSRTLNSAESLSQKVEAKAVTNISSIITDADLYIFSVKDLVLKDIISQLQPNQGIWIHTAGSMPLNIFEGHNLNYGVLYPFQTFSKNRNVDWNNIPLFVEANNKQSLDIIKSLASKVSDNIREISSEQRSLIHLTGVFACNFVNHMYTLSQQILDKANLPLDIAIPLIDETTSKIHTMSPIEAQTGPAVRYDKNVMNYHLSLIDNPQIKEIYKLISESIHNNTN